MESCYSVCNSLCLSPMFKRVITDDGAALQRVRDLMQRVCDLTRRVRDALQRVRDLMMQRCSGGVC